MKTCDTVTQKKNSGQTGHSDNEGITQFQDLPQATRTGRPGSQAQADGLALCLHRAWGRGAGVPAAWSGNPLPFLQQAQSGFRFRVQGERQELQGDWPRGRVPHHKVFHLDLRRGGLTWPRTWNPPKVSLSEEHDQSSHQGNTMNGFCPDPGRVKQIKKAVH